MTALPMGAYLTVFYVLCYQLVYMTLYSAVFISISRTIVIFFPMRGNEVNHVNKGLAHYRKPPYFFARC